MFSMKKCRKFFNKWGLQLSGFSLPLFLWLLWLDVFRCKPRSDQAKRSTFLSQMKRLALGIKKFGLIADITKEMV